MTTIGPNTRINGRLEGDADVLVEGRVDGTIALSETLTVAQDGFVTGDVEAKIVVIEGYASGTLRASQVVHLTATAQVEGEIFANAVRLDPGARLRGRIEMDVAAAPPLPARSERPARAPRKQEARSKPAAEPAPASTPAATPAPAPVAEPQPRREEPRTQKARPVERAPEPAAERAPAPRPKAASSTVVDIDPDELTVKELREMLTERGLPLSGTKTELVRRLRTGE